MSSPIAFALNQMAAPSLKVPEFLDLAAKLGCVGVELRNDLIDKQLSTSPFFDGLAPQKIGEMAKQRNLRLLGLSEAYGFNEWSDAMADRVKLLIEQANLSGAESFSLIPLNSGADEPRAIRGQKLRNALSHILKLMEGSGLIGLVEPLGFPTSSLRMKAEAVAAINEIGGQDHFKLVHDTFHHHLSSETEYFAAQTGIVHISGVIDAQFPRDEMQDHHRILIDARDVLQNIPQIKDLIVSGYQGAFSFEPFSPTIHALSDVANALQNSMNFIREQL